ncbi:MAG: type II toxin-antitoxin system mRNA interferase toxin, RelE/StbE family [Candidatus Woesebacteria bacterium]|nr:type II toxin-antitoxin system mRNA interferase toxin, RelE/StbE family [Candidatus Woesebacteria bacterium]
MKIILDSSYLKSFKKRVRNNAKLALKTRERIKLFVENSRNPMIKDHQLTGDKKEFRAFWITGDIRIMYFPISKDEVLFIDIGTHNQVY